MDETIIETMKRYKLPDIHFAELIHAGSKTLCSEICKLN
jgi:hypothetical protein